MLTMAIQAERQARAQKQQRQQLYLKGLDAQRKQEDSDLKAAREARTAAEHQRRADYKTQIDVENLKIRRSQLDLGRQRLSWDQQKAMMDHDYKILADIRNRMQRRADMIQTLNMQMYALAMRGGKDATAQFADAKKNLANTKNTFAAVQQAIQWWDRDPALRDLVISNANDALFNRMWDIPGVKKAMENLKPEQRTAVQQAITNYAALPKDQRPQYLAQLQQDEKTAESMSTVYNGFQDPKQAVQFVEAVIQKTNKEIDALYAQMPSFNGVDPQPIFRQHIQPSTVTTGQAAEATAVGGTLGAAGGEQSQKTEEPEASEETADTSGTNSEGYYDDNTQSNDEEETASADTSSGQTNDSGYYDDEET